MSYYCQHVKKTTKEDVVINSVSRLVGRLDMDTGTCKVAPATRVRERWVGRTIDEIVGKEHICVFQLEKYREEETEGERKQWTEEY